MILMKNQDKPGKPCQNLSCEPVHVSPYICQSKPRIGSSNNANETKKPTQADFICVSVKKTEETSEYHGNDIKIGEEKKRN
jgi:hypothetical protein